MALVNEQRVKDTTTTTGTGSLTCTGTAPTGYRSFAAAYAAISGSTANICIDDGAGNWEIVIGTVTISGGVATVARTTFVKSSSGSAINFAGGTKNIFVHSPSDGFLAASNNLSDVPNAALALVNLVAPGLAAANTFTLQQIIRLAGALVSPNASTALLLQNSTAADCHAAILGATTASSQLRLSDPTVGEGAGCLIAYFNSAHASAPNTLQVYTAGVQRVSLDSGGWKTAAGVTYDAFPAATALWFKNTAAPTGWVKSTSDNDAALRVVSGTPGASGGTVGVSANNVTQGHVITLAELAAHAHAITNNTTNGSGGSFVGLWDIGTVTSAGSGVTGSSGGDAAHTHPLSIVKYVDGLIAVKS